MSIVIVVSLLRHISTMYFFFNDTAPTEIYTLSLHDALPICPSAQPPQALLLAVPPTEGEWSQAKVLDLVRQTLDRARYRAVDRKSTRLNSSHANISYAVFCLKKKKITN